MANKKSTWISEKLLSNTADAQSSGSVEGIGNDLLLQLKGHLGASQML